MGKGGKNGLLAIWKGRKIKIRTREVLKGHSDPTRG